MLGLDHSGNAMQSASDVHGIVTASRSLIPARALDRESRSLDGESFLGLTEVFTFPTAEAMVHVFVPRPSLREGWGAPAGWAHRRAVSVKRINFAEPILPSVLWTTKRPPASLLDAHRVDRVEQDALRSGLNVRCPRGNQVSFSGRVAVCKEKMEFAARA